MFITTASETTYRHEATEAEAIYLEQIIDIDGRDAVVLTEEPQRNASGRQIGVLLTITDEAWAFVQEVISREDNH